MKAIASSYVHRVHRQSPIRPAAQPDLRSDPRPSGHGDNRGHRTPPHADDDADHDAGPAPRRALRVGRGYGCRVAPLRARGLLPRCGRPAQASLHRRHVTLFRRGPPRPRSHPARGPLSRRGAHRDAVGGGPGGPSAGTGGHPDHARHDERIRRVRGGDHGLRVPLPEPSLRHHHLRRSRPGAHGGSGHAPRARVGAPDGRGLGLLRGDQHSRARRLLWRLPRHARGRPLPAHHARDRLRHDVSAPGRPDGTTASCPAPHRGRGHRKPAARAAHRCRAGDGLTTQRGPIVEAPAGAAPHGTAPAQPGLARIRRLHDGTLEGRITQPCLVLAGDADQYVPFERLGDVHRALRNAKSLEVHAFHHAQDPDMAQHCQIGDLDRAFAIMGEWLSRPQPHSGA